jgi:hypothetical protein
MEANTHLLRELETIAAYGDGRMRKSSAARNAYEEHYAYDEE